MLPPLQSIASSLIMHCFPYKVLFPPQCNCYFYSVMLPLPSIVTLTIYYIIYKELLPLQCITSSIMYYLFNLQQTTVFIVICFPYNVLLPLQCIFTPTMYIIYKAHCRLYSYLPPL